MNTTYRIHPAIGLARVGDSPTDFYIGPETAGGLPIACDADGTTSPSNQPDAPDGEEATTHSFKDSQNRVKRQAARFKIFVYDDDDPTGRELVQGDTIHGIGSSGPLVDIEWTVYLANKKATWYQFRELSGEHGYAPDHPLRNAEITDDGARQRLIIDPGPQTVHANGGKRRARLARGENPGYAQSFPPAGLEPQQVDTLGEILTNGTHLLVLGGHGNSGSFKQSFGHPRIDHFANNDGWFDDVSDGPVTAKLKYHDAVDDQDRYIQVEDPAWVIVGQPGYVPELANLVTLDDVVYNVAVRQFAFDPYLYGTGPFDKKQTVEPDELEAWRAADKKYNPDYCPLFFKEIWPLLERPHSMGWLASLVDGSSDPHEPGPMGNFDLSKISVPPYEGQDDEAMRRCAEMRLFIYISLRQPGEENTYLNQAQQRQLDRMVRRLASRLEGTPLMPLLCGDNPLSNTLSSKFLRLSDTQLFLLGQWALGLFANEQREDFGDAPVAVEPPGVTLDRAVLSNALGGAFCPGGEVSWIIRNPAVYQSAYRLHANRSFLPGLQTSSVITTPGIELYERHALHQKNPISDGLEPGDMTKYSPLPWQADFNECSYQTVDVTYEEWSRTYPDDPDDRTTQLVLWWPAHRPMQVQVASPQTEPGQEPDYHQLDWSRGIPQTAAGDLRMVTAWKDLGFILNVAPADEPPFYAEVQRNNAALGA